MIKILEEQNKTKLITIYDIANEAGVSAATVSRAISGRGYVSEKNKTIISELVNKYNFRPNTFAQNLQSGFTKMVGFVVPHIGNMYFADVYFEFEKWASTHGYMTILLNSKGDYELESKLLSGLVEKRVDGIVMMGGRLDAVNLEDKYIKEIDELRKVIPFVSCSAKSERFGCHGVYTDDDYGVEAMLLHLSSKGYRKICFIGGGDEYYPSYIKKKSALHYGEKLGLSVSVRRLTGEDVFSYTAGYDGMKIILQEKNLPEVICGMNDYVAVGAVNAALEAGLKIPEDLAITGFDNVSISTMMPIHISTVSPRYEYFGKKVFSNLQKLMLNKDNNIAKTTMIKPELVIRNSTR